ncbi:hypothetical protein HELRODRAFT_188173 [Helobdella robusta]|uniref:Uncharacterized protein n=1 Tax=Helobdella robusta TaxID=6412 RepID=T1FPQ5_HELRO|nr:hypothetical protein HELRODRAFT_188173 [Helobdella robusta]ESO13230.1 hypothetical protein HELRODRAFT_188173 [Helobdella robusta]
MHPRRTVDAVFNQNSSRSPNRKSSDGKRRGTMGSDEQTIGIPTEYGSGNYYTISGADAGYLKDSISKNYHLQPVRESERHPATMSTSLTSSSGHQKKHGLFSKKDPKRETSPTPAGAPPSQLRNTPSPHSRHHSGPNSKQHSGGKVKHFIDSFRHKTKSNACDCPEISSVSSAEAHHCCETGESRFTVTAAGTVAESSPRHIHPNQHFHHPAVRQMSALSPSLEIGPDQYLEMHHRHRTQSDTTKLLLARKQARDRFVCLGRIWIRVNLCITHIA